MRPPLVTLGVAAILAYSVLGALVMNRWAVVAASGVPLEATITAMTAAQQQYSTVPGIVFASVGAVLALTWGVVTLLPRIHLPAWAAISTWGTILALGAPVYFFASFGNLNSVGDTFYDWNSEAAFALASPFYIVSGLSELVALTALLAFAFTYWRKDRAGRGAVVHSGK